MSDDISDTDRFNRDSMQAAEAAAAQKRARQPYRYDAPSEADSRREAANALTLELAAVRRIRTPSKRDFHKALIAFDALRRHHAGRLPDALESHRVALKQELALLGDAGLPSPTLPTCIDKLVQSLQFAFGVHDALAVNTGGKVDDDSDEAELELEID